MAHHQHSLDAIFHPRSVAIVGASATPGRVGHTLLHNLLASPFGGPVYPVNPNRRSVQGVFAYPSLKAVPDQVSMVVIATPAAGVPEQIEAAVECGAKAAVVISAGFSEMGPAGRALEQQIRDIAKGKLRLIGPNCLGVICPPANLNASFAASMALLGNVALLSQSGAVCTSILDWSLAARVGFSAFVSVGTMADVDFGDLIDYFGDDPNTRSIVLYMESVGNVRSFLSAARAVSRTKPVIVVKAGRHEAAAKAAASHTGALAGSDDAFDAALRRAGVLRVETTRDLFNMAEILATQPPPRGPALCVVTNAGGAGVMATDALMGEGGRLAELTTSTIAALNKILPPYWSRANPVDILGDATAERYRQALEICVRDENVDGLLILLAPQAMTDPTEVARLITPFAHIERKPVLASWIGETTVRAGRDLLQRAGLPTFDTPEAAVRAFMSLNRFRRAQEQLYETPVAVPDHQPNADAVRRVIATARHAERRLLTEVEAKDLLAAYGLPVIHTVPAISADEAVATAEQLGYPVVIKLLSLTITHKSDAGGVVLHIADAAGVRRAFDAVQRGAASYAREHGVPPETAFSGVSVQPMASADGYELILGSTIDAQFGPVMLFGMGGVLVEVFQDTAMALPPLTRTLARRLMERTSIFRALNGVRGRRAVDLAALETIIVRFSQLVADMPDVAEIDINPLLAGSERVVALDARVLLIEEGVTRPGLAILPYPNQYTAPFQCRDGTVVTVRVIRPEDEPLIVEHHAQLSDESIRFRFFNMVKHLTHERLNRLCHLDYNREMALVAVRIDANGPQIHGVSRYTLDPETRRAEFALVVADPYQGRGLGLHLMQRLIEVARDRSVRQLWGPVLTDNRHMLDLVERLNFTTRPSDEPTAVEATLQL